MEDKKSWHFDPKTKRSASLNEDNKDKKYLLLDATEEDTKEVIGLYQRHPVAGYEIGRVQVIYNRTFNSAFELHLEKLQNRNKNSAFIPQWSGMPNADMRKFAYDIFIQFTKLYTDPAYPAVKLLPAWHGTKPESLDSLFSAGYANLGTTDNGFFGKGYYSAYEAEYSHRVYSKGALILNWVASFSPLPVVNNDMKALGLEGSSNYGNYDAHFVPVASRNPDNPNETVYYPCKTMEEHIYTEMVVFESAALLPRYLVELQATLPKKPSVTFVPKIEKNILNPALNSAARGEQAEKILKKALSNSISNGLNQLAKKLINLNINVELKNNVDLCKALLKLGADIETTDCDEKISYWKDGRTPLHWAAASGKLEVIKILVLEGKCNINAQNLNGWTSLHIICKENKEYKILKILLENGANTEIKTNNKSIHPSSTPLHIAVFYEKFEAVKLLLDHDANIEAKNSIGETPIYIASNKKNELIIDLLMKYGANIRSRSDKGHFAMGCPGLHSNDKHTSLSRYTEELFGKQVGDNIKKVRFLENKVVELNLQVQQQQKEIDALKKEKNDIERLKNGTLTFFKETKILKEEDLKNLEKYVPECQMQ